MLTRVGDTGVRGGDGQGKWTYGGVAVSLEDSGGLSPLNLKSNGPQRTARPNVEWLGPHS